ncbi:MAG TPA: DUF1579 domain-containing protein [Allosphingosinicella sp.]|nr:DUF1579 domain-containing protein [Allosphingosinicella sp.]
MIRFARYALAAGLLAVAAPAAAQYPDPAPRIAAQREAMGRLAFMDGVWRGPAWSLAAGGRREMIQTERMGPMLGGAIRVMEGRGYTPDGNVAFNAFGIVSYDPDRRAYSLTSYALGHHATVPLTLTDTGFVWETPAGPGAIIRYTATIRDGTWHEVGERIAPGQPPLRVVELNLRRVGDSDWPSAGAVPMR